MKWIKSLFKIIKRVFYFFYHKQRRFRNRLFIRIKVKKLLRQKSDFKHKSKEDKEYLKQSGKFLQKNFNGYKNTRWHYLYSKLNGIKSVEYIPEELYFSFIEPVLNNRFLSKAYSDKNAYSLFFDKKNLPEAVYKIINGNFYTDNFEWVNQNDAIRKILSLNEKLVLKPAINSGGGRNVVVEAPKAIIKNLKDVLKNSHKSYILQKFVKQHSDLKQLHPSSLNTLRIMTARVDNDVVLLSVYLRTGRNNSVVDNGMAGGIICGVEETGKLMEIGYDKYLNKFDRHPDTKVIFKDIKVPGFSEALKFCKTNHKLFPHFTFISWDIGIKEDGNPIFIEFNLGIQAINGHQILNGPLFGKHIQYFIEKYNKNRNKNIYTIR